MKILIADDEREARQRLARMIALLYPNSELIFASNGDIAFKETQRREVDIALLDIRMPVLDGLAAAHRMSLLRKVPFIIFTTAWEQHALEAFNRHAVAYLLKPVREEELRFALERAQHLNADSQHGLPHDGIAPDNRRRNFSIVVGRSVELVPVEQISYVRADLKCVFLGHMNDEKLLDEPLSFIEEEFSDLLLRIHRNALAAVHDIKEIYKNPNDGHWKVLFRNHQRHLLISRRRLYEVKKRIKSL
ncbi:MAG: LytR/AlgR family response regulator transcription factor [Candidatus Eutrophobiaceae bacterium]